ncbi:hypothetical protein JTB14_036332 [Gonioctena quinquepunctata]|nr:hypothetical protein JTB14_036332 [Gonioctena quinquepunctata]
MDSSAEKSSRKRVNSSSIDFYDNVTPYKIFKYPDHSDLLPDEMFLHIFSFLSTEELYRVVRSVCKRWFLLSSTPSLWKKITAEEELPYKVLHNCSLAQRPPFERTKGYKCDRADCGKIQQEPAKYEDRKHRTGRIVTGFKQAALPALDQLQVFE